MALADTANLLVKLSLGGNFLSQIGKATTGLNKFDTQLGKTESRAFRAGQQIGTGIKNAGRLAAVGIGFLVSQVALGLNSLIELEKATAQTNAVIASTKGVAGVTGAEVTRLSEKFESLNATVGDEFIRAGQNMLLTFTNIRGKAFEPALEAVLNMNTAMGKGPEGLVTTAILVGKALNDPIKGVTALRKNGVALTAAQTEQIKVLVKQNKLYEAQQIILGELNTEFAGSFAAQGNTTAGKIAKFTDSIEDLQRALAEALLPTLGNVADALSKMLGDEKVQQGVRDFGKSLANLISPANLAEGGRILGEVFNAARAAAPGIAAAAQIMGQVVGTAVKMFNSLPKEIQQLAIGAFAINKLTGGLVTNLAGGLISGVLKQLVSGVVNVRGASVIVTGGVGATGVGAAGAAAGLGAKSVWSTVGKIIGGAFAIVAVAEIAGAIHGAISREGGLEGRIATGTELPADKLSWPFGPKNTPRWIIDSPFGPINVLGGDSTLPPKVPASPEWADKLTSSFNAFAAKLPATTDGGGRGIRSKVDESAIRSRAEAAGFKPTDLAIQATLQRNIIREQAKTKAAVDAVKAQEARTTSAVLAGTLALQGLSQRQIVVPAPNVTVNVTASSVSKSIVINNRYNPHVPSRHATNRGPLP